MLDQTHDNAAGDLSALVRDALIPALSTGIAMRSLSDFDMKPGSTPDARDNACIMLASVCGHLSEIEEASLRFFGYEENGGQSGDDIHARVLKAYAEHQGEQPLPILCLAEEARVELSQVLVVVTGGASIDVDQRVRKHGEVLREYAVEALGLLGLRPVYLADGFRLERIE